MAPTKANNTPEDKNTIVCTLETLSDNRHIAGVWNTFTAIKPSVEVDLILEHILCKHKYIDEVIIDI